MVVFHLLAYLVLQRRRDGNVHLLENRPEGRLHAGAQEASAEAMASLPSASQGELVASGEPSLDISPSLHHLLGVIVLADV